MRLDSTGHSNLTLSDRDLSVARPMRGEGGRRLRAYCPFHQSDHQRSLSVDLETGRFRCFACGAWGYTEEARQRWREERARQANLRPLASGNAYVPAGDRKAPPGQRVRPAPLPPAPPPPPQAPLPPPPPTPKPPPFLPPDELLSVLATYQAALPGSPAERYLAGRKIPLALAQEYGLGYASPGHWAHKVRDWKDGRLVFPHTTPAGTLVNLYGRAIGSGEVPKALRHDHLPGDKGCFNARALGEGASPVYVCEGPFDALSLIAAGCERAVAIFGVHGWRWDWVRGVRRLVFAFDADQAGEGWRHLARQAILRRIEVAFLNAEDYGGRKDVNEAWTAGVLSVAEWPAADSTACPTSS